MEIKKSCTFTLFSELLASRENISLSVDEVRVLLTKEYILSPRTQKSTRKRLKKELLAMQQSAKNKIEKAKIQANIVAIQDAHPRKPRCQYFGEEVQMDACKHVWFGDSYSHLHIALDDSTGNIVGGYYPIFLCLFPIRHRT